MGDNEISSVDVTELVLHRKNRETEEKKQLIFLFSVTSSLEKIIIYAF